MFAKIVTTAIMAAIVALSVAAATHAPSPRATIGVARSFQSSAFQAMP